MEEIKVKYLRDIKPIKQIKNGDWIDLVAAKSFALRKGEFVYIPLGVAMELPAGYEALIVPRSSTAKNLGILMANSMAVIDESYKGDNDEWHFPAYATRETYIRKNERICQFRIIEHQPAIKLVEVDHLGNEDRGGLGSTGRM